MYWTLVTPITLRKRSAGTFVGPGLGALPGAGCGKAVDVAVWKVTLPSTFLSTWWMWPLSTVTEPKRFNRPSARSASSVPQPHCGYMDHNGTCANTTRGVLAER